MSNIQISIVQADLQWESKPENLHHLEAMIMEHKLNKSIVFLPEMFNTGFTMNTVEMAETMQGPTLIWMKEIAAKQKIILCGSLIIKEDGSYYNRLVWVQPDGIVSHYDKRHLFAYAKEDHYFAAGDNKLLVQVNNWKLQLNVCYDLRFPVWSRQSNDPNLQYDVLVYVASWPEKRSYAWQQLLIARAIENQSYVIGVNRVGTDGNGIIYNGCSAMIDPSGKILWELKDKEGVGTIQLKSEELVQFRAQFPFLKDGDLFTML